MIIKKTVFLLFLLWIYQPIDGNSLAEQFQQFGYLEICDKNHEVETFESLYKKFDDLIRFLQENSIWAKKLYAAKEQFIRSKDQIYYSTDFFGFYDESKIPGRYQISFYYSIHFHKFVCSLWPEINQIPQVINFFQACFEVQQPCANLFNQAATALNLETIFVSKYEQPPILFKIVKYLPSYIPIKPHYDGTAFTLLLDSTDDDSLLLCPYKSSFLVQDFYSPSRTFSCENNQKSILLIPGALLTEFFIYPTPHIVTQSGKTRYAAVAFAMRPHYASQKNDLSPLPNFKNLE